MLASTSGVGQQNTLLTLRNGWEDAMLRIPNTRVCVLPTSVRVVGGMLGYAGHW